MLYVMLFVGKRCCQLPVEAVPSSPDTKQVSAAGEIVCRRTKCL